MSDLNRCHVVPIVLEKHPNADTLSIVNIGGYTCIVKTEQFLGIDRAAYINPDNTVPVDKEVFKFLEDQSKNGRARIKARKFREIWSQGLLIPLNDTYSIGQDVTEEFDVQRYESESDRVMNNAVSGQAGKEPTFKGSKYDIESYFKYLQHLPEGTPVVITEKLHGMNFRASYQNGKFYVGSRNLWLRNPLQEVSFLQKIADRLAVNSFVKKYLVKFFNYRPTKTVNEMNTFWKVFYDNPWIGEFCKNHPNVILYGEILGTQFLKYDTKNNHTIRVFDVFDPTYPVTNFWDYETFACHFETNQIAPEIDVDVPFTKDLIDKYISGKSLMGDHIREGIVIKPMEEINAYRFGRVILKAVSPEYLAHKGNN